MTLLIFSLFCYLFRLKDQKFTKYDIIIDFSLKIVTIIMPLRDDAKAKMVLDWDKVFWDLMAGNFTVFFDRKITIAIH